MIIKKGPRINFLFLFILILIIGVICLFFTSRYLIPYYAEPTKELGIALIIASILGMTTESFIHGITEERIKKIEDSATRALLRELTGNTVYNIIYDHIISKPFTADKFRLTFQLKKEEDDKVNFTVISTTEITNIGDVDSKHKIQLHSSLKCGNYRGNFAVARRFEALYSKRGNYLRDLLDNNMLAIYKMKKNEAGDFIPVHCEKINLINKTVETIEDEKTIKTTSFNNDTENIILKHDPQNHFLDFSYYYRLKPGEKIRIEKKQSDIAKNDDFFYFPISETVIDGPLAIKIDHNPEELECFLRLTHPNLVEKELKPSADGYYDINEGLIPGFGILLSWSQSCNDYL